MTSLWALFAVVFTASYTANLAAFMITKEDFDKLDGINDPKLIDPLSHSPPFKFATIPSGSTEVNLKKNYPQMHAYMQKWNKKNVSEGLKAVKERLSLRLC